MVVYSPSVVSTTEQVKSTILPKEVYFRVEQGPHQLSQLKMEIEIGLNARSIVYTRHKANQVLNDGRVPHNSGLY